MVWWFGLSVVGFVFGRLVIFWLGGLDFLANCRLVSLGWVVYWFDLCLFVFLG